ncbi:hypothetical protein MGYG_02651 [Nannizzia gypsea CBS 118893]|uniref:Uncharacterized protein n=1 Tax=Arthroderma gypseum (strain ATCC MYA-4604 / CBS 118893) TaxID=535722 RepID=E4UNN6_ARTGP|nr:hypothetical protein MGYG_02651 [Nannizzia gypsea CBS 118893]EFQ99639.1 hypothetical protein MGYG_02651 [Nannizzia gypsea CBS 118893]
MSSEGVEASATNQTNHDSIASAPVADAQITSTSTDADKPEATANGDEKPESAEITEKPAVETKPAAPAEDKADEEAKEEAKGEAKEETIEETKEQPEVSKEEKETGQKRDHAAMSTTEPAAATTDSKEENEEPKAESSEPAEKKQKVEKTDEAVTAVTTAPAADATENGNVNGSAGNDAAKRGPGRPKKSGRVSAASQKKKTPTPRSSDGVGSRCIFMLTGSEMARHLPQYDASR